MSIKLECTASFHNNVISVFNYNLVLMIMYMMSQWNFTHNVTKAGPKVTNTTHTPLLRILCPSLLHSRTQNELMARSSAGTLRMPFLSSDAANFISGRWAHNHCATLLVILVILSHCHQWQAQSHLDPTIPEALEREKELFGQKCFTAIKTNRKKREVKPGQEHLR